MDTPTEAEAAAYLRNLHELEQAGERTSIAIGPFSAIVVIGALQLATRHPSMSEDHRELIGQVVDQMRPLFAGTIGEQIIDGGNDPEQDR